MEILEALEEQTDVIAECIEELDSEGYGDQLYGCINCPCLTPVASCEPGLPSAKLLRGARAAAAAIVDDHASGIYLQSQVRENPGQRKLLQVAWLINCPGAYMLAASKC